MKCQNCRVLLDQMKRDVKRIRELKKAVRRYVITKNITEGVSIYNRISQERGMVKS